MQVKPVFVMEVRMLANKIGVIATSLTTALENLLVRRNESQFRMFDDLDSKVWSDYIRHAEKFTVNVHKHFFQKCQ